MVIRISRCKDLSVQDRIYCVSSLWLFLCRLGSLMGELMRGALLSIDDLQRCKTPAAVWNLAKFLLVVSGYIKRKVL